MRSSYKNGETDSKKKYVFFSDPDIVVQRAETSAAATRDLKDQRQQDHSFEETSKQKSGNQPIHFNFRGLENFLSFYPVQPYPFTFLSAVKRKLALANSLDSCKKQVYEPSCKEKTEPSLTILKSNSSQNLFQVVQKMDLIKLKVPDLKIASKSLDFSTRDNLVTKELASTKFAEEVTHEKSEKSTKIFERVQRKLDFSSSDTSSIINSSDIIEPLKVPNISIASNLSKKKEHLRDNCREKENRSKRIKKDESLFAKQDEMAQDIFKRSKHISRKEIADNSSESIPASELSRDKVSFYLPRESDFALTKRKTKNFATSTAKKDNDKRHRSVNIRSLKARDDSIESKSRTCSSESVFERFSKISDKITTREYPRNMFENSESRYRDEFDLLNQVGDEKHTFLLDNRQGKQNKTLNQRQVGCTGFKDQTKRPAEKIKPSVSKLERKTYLTNSKESEDIETVTDSNNSLRARSPSTSLSAQQIKVKVKIKDSDKGVENTSVVKPNKIVEDSTSYTAETNRKKGEELVAQSITTSITKQTSIGNDSDDLNETIISEALLDPRRISFRDESYSQQEEFNDLVTPDINLILRSKRRKQFLEKNDSEPDVAESNYDRGIKVETEEKPVPLLHPTALHMQFQAELHLFDSVNESLRQVMDVEKCILPINIDALNEGKTHFSKILEERSSVDTEHSNETSKSHKHTNTEIGHYAQSKTTPDESTTNNNLKRASKKSLVKAVEVQTQTVNDIATQTYDIPSSRRNTQSRCPEICGITYEQSFVGDSEVPQLSLDSAEQFEDLDQLEEISLPSKLRTMSEISLHETTSSIRTETGTEISISTRGVTCSFNKYLDLELAQLIKDENQRNVKIEMLFKSREKTLNDRTKKLVKLEEQKRALRDTGQDSRISSVKKKQRALLLKLQQEKDEMNRLKELHKIASQERKLVLQKQRNMFNPQMSTKNILTKLKRSADNQSPRRLSGPMKGYDIRSNSSMSSLVDSDKSQHDRSQADGRLQLSENDLRFPKLDLSKPDKFANFPEEPNASLSRFGKSTEGIQEEEKCPYKSPKEGTKGKYEIKSRKFEEKMPRADILRLKSHQHSIESMLIQGHPITMSGQYLFEKEKSPDVFELLQPNLNKSSSERAKSVSHALEEEQEQEEEEEELSKRSLPCQATDSQFQSSTSSRDRRNNRKISPLETETIQEEIASINQDSTISKTSKSSQVSEDILQTHSKSSKKTSSSSSKSILTDKDVSKKMQYTTDSKSSSKRKTSKCQKSKSSSSSSSILTENILRSKSNSQITEELNKHHGKRTKVEKEFLVSDENDENAILDTTDFDENPRNPLHASLVKHSKVLKDKNSKLLGDIIINNCESKENVLCQKIFDRNIGVYDKPPRSQEKSLQSFDNISSVKSQVSTFAVSRQSSGESEQNYSKSVVVRSQDDDLKTSKKFDRILNAREAALASRKNCVEEWMAWHAKLRAEEEHVTRMEQAALKLVTTTSNVFSQQERSVCTFIDTTVSSDTSDIEGRIELLTEKLAERRIEMSRLKREARKQTKQKLRSLEANLLNQIKKYDTTIHEMRKKLDSKKIVTKDDDSDNNKLAIESKSLADFKVPEIPLKRIQDIYRNNDLLRSRSESDLPSTKRQALGRDGVKNIVTLRNENSIEENNRVTKMTRVNKRASNFEQLSSLRMDSVDHNVQSTFDEGLVSDADKLVTPSVNLGEPLNPNQQTSRKHVERILPASEASISEDVKYSDAIKTEISTAKSETDIPIATVSEAKTFSTLQSDRESNNFDTFSKESESKVEQIQNTIELSENVSAKSQPLHADHSNTETSIRTMESGNEVVNFSRQLDSLHLNNKNLNEDLSSLENELKVMTEIMSRISQKSAEESKTTDLRNEEKSTSKDISEIVLNSDKTDRFDDAESRENYEIEGVELNRQEEEEEEEDSNSDLSRYLTSSRKLKSASSDFNNVNNSKSIAENVDDVMSAILPQAELSLYRSSQEIDYKARSKEILNEIEKSIISEHIRTSENDFNRSTVLPVQHDDIHLNDQLSTDVNSPETEVKSIAEIYSEVLQDTELVASAAAPNNLSDLLYVAEHDANLSNEIPAADDFHLKLSEEIDKEDIETNMKKSPLANEDWTISDSFEVERNIADPDWEQSQIPNENFQSYSDDGSSSVASDNRDLSLAIDNFQVDDVKDINVGSDIEDVSIFIPKGESTNIETSYGMKFDETMPDSPAVKSADDLDDILDIIAREDQRVNEEQKRRKDVLEDGETDGFQKAIHDSATKILDKVEKSIESTSVSVREKIDISPEESESEIETAVDESKSISSNQKETEIVANVNTISLNGNEAIDDDDEDIIADEPCIGISVRINIKGDNQDARQVDSKSQEILLPELEFKSTELSEVLPDIEVSAKLELAEDKSVTDSSDGEQLDNLVEIAESGLETIEKNIKFDDDDVADSKNLLDDEPEQRQVTESKLNDRESITVAPVDKSDTSTPEVSATVANKTFDVLKDPEYEDISEESLEVSEILDKNQSYSKSVASLKSCSVPDKYEAVQGSDEVLRILDKIALKSSVTTLQEFTRNLRGQQATEDNENFCRVNLETANNLSEDKQLNSQTTQVVEFEKEKSIQLEDGAQLVDREETEKSGSEEKVSEKCEQDASSDSSEGRDTPKGVSEIEMDSPRDPNDSRLDIEALNDDLLTATENLDSKTFHATPIAGTSEKDLEIMIDKLKASLEQPGLERPVLEQKVLHIQRLQVELELKKLEAEEVSYYIREIPNKPPPPYTPPGGGGRIPTSLASPSPPPAVTPSNVDELTAFTEKATVLIFKAKEAGEDITSLEAPPEIYELTKENDETVKKDRRIYNTFLFDLCKETIAEIYQAEYEKPGPSWTKPNVKTKPTMKIPKTVDELNDYVSKEVATLFGFKTKLQRENMVMRWSRKRRDRVDELLAREAQAEEDEWTKFHHDELAVKNGLTVAILDTLITESINVVKVAYAKKRKIIL